MMKGVLLVLVYSEKDMSCVRGRRETKTRESTWKGPGCCGATRKAVIVDRIDYFLYFGAIML